MGELNDAWEKYGCNYHDLIVLGIGGNNNSDADILFAIDDMGVEFPCCSVDGGGGEVTSDYGVTGWPSLRVIAPDKTIIFSDYHPNNQLDGVISSGGVQPNDCNPVKIGEENSFFKSNSTPGISIGSITTRRISVFVPAAGFYTLGIYSADGKMQKKIMRRNLSKGNNKIVWNGCRLARGLYFVELYIGKQKVRKKAILF